MCWQCFGVNSNQKNKNKNEYFETQQKKNQFFKKKNKKIKKNKVFKFLEYICESWNQSRKIDPSDHETIEKKIKKQGLLYLPTLHYLINNAASTGN